tara:strand:- start:83 stop:208 length:126 start_codon:yes stop_codon:yes gene_type:complete
VVKLFKSTSSGVLILEKKSDIVAATAAFAVVTAALTFGGYL